MTLLLLLALVPAPQEASWEVLPHDALQGDVRAVEVTDRAVWLAVRGSGLVRLDGEGTTRVGTGDGLVSHGVADLHRDRRGRLWATGLHGYSVLADGSWTPYRTLGPISPRVVYGVHEEPGTGAIWLATSGGAARVEPGGDGREAGAVVLPSAGLPHPVVHAVLVDRAGTLWLATRGGLARASPDGLETLHAGTNFRSILEGPDGTLWFGTSDGALEWRDAGPVRHMAGRTVLPRMVGPDGSVWATDPDGLLRYRGGAWSRIPLPATLAGAEIHDLAMGRDGTLWLATSRGAARYRPGG